jgi:transposase-like protein
MEEESKLACPYCKKTNLKLMNKKVGIKIYLCLECLSEFVKIEDDK